jgi:fibronectin-binding autotransporter adhesin
MKPKNTLRHFLLLAGSSLLAISYTHADQTWDGGGADNNWNTPENWGGDTLPTLPGDITFAGDTRNAAANDFAAATTITGISFTNDGSAGQANAFTLSGNSITLGNGFNDIVTTAITTGPTITDVISLNLTLTATNKQFNTGLGHDLLISGNISGESNSHFNKLGYGTVTLSGLNSSGGAMLIHRGTVNANTIFNTGVASSIGAGNNIQFNGTNEESVLNYTGAATSTTKLVTLGGNGTAGGTHEGLVGRINNNGTGALVFTSGNLINRPTVLTTTARTLVLGGANTDANAVNGVIRDNLVGVGGNGAVNLTKEDAGTWILYGDNTHSGATTINGGILQFGNINSMPAASAVTVNDTATLAISAGGPSYLGRFEFTNATSGNGTIGGLLAGIGGKAGSTVSYNGNVRLGIDTTNATGASLTYAGVIGNVGTSLGLTKLGTGTLVLSQANTHTGNTLVTGGNIKLGNTLALQNSAYNTASVAGGLDVTGYATPTLGGLTGSVNLDSTLITAYGSVTNLKLNLGTGITQTYSGVIANGAANMALTKSGAGTQVLSGNNSYTGATAIDAGKLLLSGSGNLGNNNYAGAIAIAADATLQKDSGGAQTLSGAITGSGSLVLNSGGALTLSSAGNNFGNLTVQLDPGLNGNGGRVFIGNTGALGSATVTIKEIVGATTGSTLVFNGAAAGSYSNAISVENGGGIAARGAVILSNVTLPGTGTVKFNNDDASTQSLAISNNQTLSGALTVQVGAEKMLTTTTLLGVVTFSGNVSGNGSLTMKSLGNVGNTNGLYGSGVLDLTGANTYTGDTTVESGTLRLTQAPNPANANTGNDASTVSIAATGATLDLTFSGTDIVNKLFIGGVQQPAGVYGPSATSIPQITNSSGSGTLTVTSGPVTGSPEIAVEQGVDIPSGGSKDFGTATIGSNNDLVFTILNTGDADLNLTGSPDLVAISGDSDFTVTVQPSTNPVPDTSGTTTFTVRFTPQTSGARSATISIDNDDSDENPFTITLNGTGQTAYDAWATGSETFDGDANGDGVKDGIAFLLGAATPGTDATGLLPTVSQSGGNLALTFSMLNAANRGDAALSVEHSRDLGDVDIWTTVLVPDATGGPTDGVTFTITANGNLNDVVATIGSAEAGGTGKLFGRIKATE